MDDLSVLVTGAGAPGIVGTVHSLRKNPEGRRVRVVGVDAATDVVGRYLCDAFHKVPKPSDPERFSSAILDVCKREGVRVVLPQVTDELPVFASGRDRFAREGVHVAVSEPTALETANNKFLLTEECKRVGVPVGDFALAANEAEFRKAVEALGYPRVPIAVKPPVSKGMRGFRVLDAGKDRYDLWWDDKPTGVYTTLDEFLSMMKGRAFPELLVMEYLPGDEFTVDALADDGKPLAVVPRRRTQIRSGITFAGVTENHGKIISYTETLIRRLGLSYAFGFQFKLDRAGVPKILECNPRIQGTMVLASFAGANVIWGATKLAAGETPAPMKPVWGQQLLRYWGAVSVDPSGRMVDKL
ncbi:MAG: ATP-grasp domain-containing protein [Methanobacteriota archaeon]